LVINIAPTTKMMYNANDYRPRKSSCMVKIAFDFYKRIAANCSRPFIVVSSLVHRQTANFFGDPCLLRHRGNESENCISPINFQTLTFGWWFFDSLTPVIRMDPIDIII